MKAGVATGDVVATSRVLKEAGAKADAEARARKETINFMVIVGETKIMDVLQE